ncbi:MAG: hypothetical protein ACLVC1_07970 [Mediterraneibacter gnavus]
MENLQVILILVVFLSGVALMMSKKLPAILSLPCMGILIAAIAGVPFMSADPEVQSITQFVIAGGSSKLAGTIMVTILGAIFAKVVQKEGISDEIIRKAAELAGDKPVMIAIALTADSIDLYSNEWGRSSYYGGTDCCSIVPFSRNFTCSCSKFGTIWIKPWIII